eukprot:scaffold7917_cov61-Phaeocystis_antarctica.AAC.6
MCGALASSCIAAPRSAALRILSKRQPAIQPSGPDNTPTFAVKPLEASEAIAVADGRHIQMSGSAWNLCRSEGI